MGRIAQQGSLATRLPKLANEWHPTKNKDLQPDNVTVSSNKKVWWLCSKCGHEWAARVNSRSRGNGCPQCARKKKIVFRRTLYDSR